MGFCIIFNQQTYIEVSISYLQQLIGQVCYEKEGVLWLAKQSIVPYQKTRSDIGILLYFPNLQRSYRYEETLLIGMKNADIICSEWNGQLCIVKQQVFVIKGTNVYLNGFRMENTKIYPLVSGDQIQFSSLLLQVNQTTITIFGDPESYYCYLLEVETNIRKKESQYHRSPRIIRKLDTKEYEIESPPNRESVAIKGILTTFIPSMLSILVSILVGLLLQSSAMLILSVVSSGTAFLVNIIQYFNDCKRMKRQNRLRVEQYQKYLRTCRQELYGKQKYNQEALAYNYPNSYEVAKIVSNNQPRIYEKMKTDADFLHISIGYYCHDSPFTITLAGIDSRLEQDHLQQEVQELSREYRKMKGIPLVISLQNGNVGMVGNRVHIHEQLQTYLLQIAAFHSYHDVLMIPIYDVHYKETFGYLKWYPHMRFYNTNRTTMIYNRMMAEQVLGSVLSILKERKNRHNENKKEKFFPHIIFIIDSPELVLEHPIMEFLQEPVNTLGFSVVYVAITQAELPDTITTIVEIDNRTSGRLIINQKKYCNQVFETDFSFKIEYEKLARSLLGLEHQEKMQSTLPKKIGLLKVYSVETVTELQVEQRWDTSKVFNSLAVPIGVRAVKDLVLLDLHEKVHGPHGLIAGTTGSGKSEIIQTYILSLAIQFHPYDVGFLLIDYKGGGMSNLFQKLPHVLGTITNLDSDEANRALIAIKSELQRRQQLFNEVHINNINDYTKQFKIHKDWEPLPHLFLIVDEFAELKKEQPDFMKELVSTARVGRSLGVHLLLATQKPTGVVDDQIWSNARFKICLKVQEESDSKEVLKTADAANLTIPGRGYLQVGNNEIYELFQSAFSGAPYHKSKIQSGEDQRVYVENELGQGHVINTAIFEENDSSIKETSELEAIIKHIDEVYQNQHCEMVKKPWQPPLKEQIVLPKLENAGKELSLLCYIGVQDLPELQKQEVYYIDLLKDGNVGYFASGGYGKTMFLSTVILSLSSLNTVSMLNLYVLDFGHQGLAVFTHLHHVADYITFDEQEKFTKFSILIEQELVIRKQEIIKNQAQNFVNYNKEFNSTLKAIVIIIDQLDIVKEKDTEMEMFFTKLLREGPTVGIYTVFSATRSDDIRYATLQHVKRKLAGYFYDIMESYSIVGRSPWKLPDIKGRMLIKNGTVHVAQMYCAAKLNGATSFIQNIKKRIDLLNAKNPTKAKKIQLLPTTLNTKTLLSYSWCEQGVYAIGLDYHTVRIRGFTPTSEPFLVVGPASSGKSNVLKVIYQQCQGTKYLFDSFKMALRNTKKEEGTLYGYDYHGYQKMYQKIKVIIDTRKVQFSEAYKKDATLFPISFYQTLESHTCFIDDVDAFDELWQQVSTADSLLEQALECGIVFVVAMDSSKVATLNSSATLFQRTSKGVVLGSCVMSNPFDITMKEAPTMPYGILFNAFGKHRIKVAEYAEWEEKDCLKEYYKQGVG